MIFYINIYKKKLLFLFIFIFIISILIKIKYLLYKKIIDIYNSFRNFFR